MPPTPESTPASEEDANLPPLSPDEELTWTWGAPDNPLDQDPIVLGLFQNPADYASALTQVGAAFPYLASWIEHGKKDPGCILERPLFGACVDNAPGMQEWNPDNEIVHRAAQLAMRRRFGQQPVWVGLGVGWNVEFDVLKSIYCFPWRNSFVSVHEHSGWEANLRRLFTKREKQPLLIDDLVACRRGSFDFDQTAIAAGTVHFIALAHPEALPKLMMELHLLREKLGRVSTDGGKTWTLAPEFDVPPSEQKAAIERVVASEFFEQAATYFRTGKKPQRQTTKRT